MINLQTKRSVRLTVDKSLLVHAAQLTLDSINAPSGSGISIIIGNDVLLKELNSKYRQVDATTDVLSFPSGETDPDSQSLYLGDVVISLPRAQDQAAAGGHPLEDELQLLVVHGVLHLLGYDHEAQMDKRRMQAVQDKILALLGVKLQVALE